MTDKKGAQPFKIQLPESAASMQTPERHLNITQMSWTKPVARYQQRNAERPGLGPGQREPLTSTEFR